MARTASILLVDDEPDLLCTLSEQVASWGFHPLPAQSGAEAISRLHSEPVDAVVTDLCMPGIDGFGVLQRALRQARPVPVIVLSGQRTITSAVQAVREGALDYLEKGASPDSLRHILQRALHGPAVRSRADDDDPAEGFTGGSAEVRRVDALVWRVARSRTSVLITGPSGSGKERVARALHTRSERRDGAFVALNCAAIPASLIESELFGHERGAFTGAEQRREGCFEQAHGGTLFLDEVGELPLPLQSRFLRVLEESTLRRVGGRGDVRVDVRLVAATHRNLADEVARGRFREDLYYRLQVFEIGMPALRDRTDDIPVLAGQFLRRFALQHGRPVRGFAPGVVEHLSAYGWPGNVRQLRNVVERAVILCESEWVGLADLPPEVRGAAHGAGSLVLPLGQTLHTVTRAYIEATLASFGGNKQRTARTLGMGERTLYTKLGQYQSSLDAPARSGPVQPGACDEDS